MTPIPIAVVGRGCVLPGALSPAELWEMVRTGHCAIREADREDWGVEPSQFLMPEPKGSALPDPDRTWSLRGGFVRGFEEVFDPSGFLLPEHEVVASDRQLRWLLHAGRQALAEAGYSTQDTPARSGLIVGNLSYPTEGHAEFARKVWMDKNGVECGASGASSRERFSSGLPAALAARALGCRHGGLALDAACASALYAVKLACDRLRDGTTDLELAGAVNAADALFLQLGFAALGALSRTGRSRPFHREADGLLPAQGAVLLALRRLPDALADGQPVLGVIRAVGLSNDGAGGGFLAPDPDGQVRALRDAYAQSGLDPTSISLVECHATGTPIGDRAELSAMRHVFSACRDLPLGSLKSNLGHLLAAAGGAALLKVLGALQAGIRPPTLGAEEPVPELNGSPFRLLRGAEPWEAQRPRRAAVNAFGFGGCNAHLILEEWDAGRPVSTGVPTPPPRGDLAVVALGVRAAGGAGTLDFLRHLFVEPPGPVGLEGGGEGFPAGSLCVDPAGMRIPPHELSDTLGQQTLLRLTTLETLKGVVLPAGRTGVFVGSGCDPESARYAGRWRAGEQGDGWVPPLTAARVKGTMPNIPANQLNRLFDLRGPGFTVSAEEASGPAALELARRALAAGEVDAAVVAAVDLSCEAVHLAAAIENLPADRHTPGDAAVVLVLRRLAEARAEGAQVLAVLPEKIEGTAVLELALNGKNPGLAPRLGHAHAASGLLLVAAGVTACAHAALPSPDGPSRAWIASPEKRTVDIRVEPPGGTEWRVRVSAASAKEEWGARSRPVPTEQLLLHCYSGAHHGELIERVVADAEAGRGPARLALLGREPAEVERLRRAAVGALRERRHPGGPGTFFSPAPITGDIAFVFAPAAAGYPGMAQELLLSFPELWESLRKWGDLSPVAEALDPMRPLGPMARATGSWALCQFHAAWTLDWLGVRPQATLGVSSGEVAALEALGAWNDPHQRLEDWVRSGILEHDLAGECRSVRRCWQEQGLLTPGEELRYTCRHVRHSVAEIRAALAAEPRVRLTTIFAPDECCISGQEADCRRVLDRLGAASRPLEFDVAAHCPEAAPSAELWRRLSHRPTRPVPGVRFYTNATNSWCTPTADAIADAYTGQALACIDFPATVERAWADGVRLFVEHGPRGMLTRCIGRILGSREHTAIALDSGSGKRAVRRLIEAGARLWCAGVPLDLERLLAATARLAPPTTATTTAMTVTVSTRLPGVRVPPAGGRPIRPRQPVVKAPAPASRKANALPDAHRDWLRGMQEAQSAFLATSRKLLSGRPVIRRHRSATPQPVGPVISRSQLETLASGKVSDVFGPLFHPQNDYPVQVRMPMPPLLLADRVVRLDAKAGSLGTGSIVTETDVTPGAWYLHAGRMTPGLMVEAGQADLLLISYLGIDLHLGGTRRYRLLGCDLTYHGPPARPGETLRYDIRIDGHAHTNDVRLFFFHYDCTVGGRMRMTVRNGQAGFFTQGELGASEGVVWDPVTAKCDPDPRLDPPHIVGGKSSLSQEELCAFAAGDAYRCFGRGFERAAPHTRTPGIPGGELLLLDRVTSLDHAGGPWGRGYLRAELDIRTDAWFFQGHFKNDPCMPGTLMLDGCVQALAVYLTSLGTTLDRDGWRFEPVAGHRLEMRCRGQVVPESRLLTYEVFVESLADGDEPTVIADVLCSVDGLKAFHCRSLGMRLVPGWPLEGDAGRRNGKVHGDHEALLACALGPPSAAFGRMYAPFDGPRPVPRLPGPPYHCISRITSMPPTSGAMQPGVSVTAELDVAAEDWYLADGGTGAMPLAVLTEAALQPCGWLASFVGCAAHAPEVVRFRNLDGAGTVKGSVLPDGGPLVTRATLTSLSRVGATTLSGFQVECEQAGRAVFSLHTTFGFFPPAALAEQVGIPADEDARSLFSALPNSAIDLRGRPSAYFQGRCRLGVGRLLLLDRITHFSPAGGKARLGALRAEKDVDPREWFFKAHFFQDPVQPGSLGLEAVAQLLQFHMLHNGLHKGRTAPRFDPVLCGRIEWKFRGQVLPTSERITITAEITEVIQDDEQAAVRAEASLWADGLRIYHIPVIGMRIVGKKNVPAPTVVPPARIREHVFSPQEQPWVLDHRPTHTLPVLPLTCLADLLAGAAVRDRPGMCVVGLREVRAFRWLVCDRDRRLRTECLVVNGAECRVRLLADRGGDWELIASGSVLTADEWPAPPAPPAALKEGEEQACPYLEDRLFHGPAFQYLRTLKLGPAGSTYHLDPGAGRVPLGTFGPGLLDAATHGIPHDSLRQWCPDVPPGLAGYPQALREVRFFGPVPAGSPVRGEARFLEVVGASPPRILIRLSVLHQGRVWADMVLEEVCLPMGFLAMTTPRQRVAFLRDRRYVEGAFFTRGEGETTRLTRRTVAECDWLPGTLAAVYGAAPEDDLCRQIAVREHVARIEKVHPSAVRWRDGETAAHGPGGAHAVRLEENGESIRVLTPTAMRERSLT
jgi:acyl transferase domain-containing protein/3-hydroxymyristoyl/3-hydroxydecanoyl-(acyl carrier protein) dehydratase